MDEGCVTGKPGASGRVNSAPDVACGGGACLQGEARERLARILESHPPDERSLVHVLQDLNREVGYLPLEALRATAARLGLPISRVASVATFYKAFNLEPRGRCVLRVCMGTACYVRGARDVAEAIAGHLAIGIGQTTQDREFTLETVNCLGACALGPMLTAGAAVHGHLDRQSAVEVVEEERRTDHGRPDGDTDPLVPRPIADRHRLTRLCDLATWRAECVNARHDAARQVLVCAGTGCRTAGAGRLALALTSEIRRIGGTASVRTLLKTTGCHGFCEKGPLVLVQPEGFLYVGVGEKDAAQIVAETVVGGRPVTRLLCADRSLRAKVLSWRELPFYARQHRLTLRNIGRIDPADLEDAVACGGYSALAKVLGSMSPEQVIEVVTRSGLRGRGGAGFPTGVKWRLCREAPVTPRAVRGSPKDGVISPDRAAKVLVCNGDEGDPGAYMDRSLFEGDPHSILEGMLIAAFAIGATEGHCYIRDEYPLALAHMSRAIDSARRVGLLGSNILGTGLDFDVRITRGGGSFVCGEETALLASIAGRPGYPVPRPPYPVQSGLDGRPTVINNVETFATIPIIVDRGPEAYAALGTSGSKGTKVFSLVGKVIHSGLVEVPMGTSLRHLVEEIGGGVPRPGGGSGTGRTGRHVKAVQIGGPSGGCLPASELDRKLDYEALAGAGAIMGSGGIIVMDDRTCMVDVARYFTQFLEHESCGKCIPCREGLGELRRLLEGITTGRSRPGDLERIERMGRMVQLGALCGLGKTAPNPVLSTLRYFRDEYVAHIEDLRCPAGVCRELARFAVNERCNGCTLCKRACPAGAITGAMREPHTIGQDLCIHCALCVDACARGAIDILGVRDLDGAQRHARPATLAGPANPANPANPASPASPAGQASPGNPAAPGGPACA